MDASLTRVNSLPFFDRLAPELREAAAAEIEWFSLPGGATLFDEGDAADAVYFVTAGSLGAYERDSDGRSRLIGRIAAGESVGEIALISGRPRSATVVALRDSELGRWPRRSFERTLANHPAAVLTIAQLIVQRLDNAQHPSATSARRSFALLPHHGVDIGRFAADLSSVLAAFGRAQRVGGESAAQRTGHWLHEVERDNAFVVYVGEPEPTAWTRQCLRQADAVLLIARAGAAATPWPALIDWRRPGRQPLPAELVLLHDGAIAAGAARRWLDAAGPEADDDMPLHHVRGGADLLRLARRLAGRAVGLTLSGGGARGFAHIGVIRALREANVPIDIVGGTSIGAIIAAGVAIGWPDDELAAHIRRAFVDTNPLSDYALPLVALTSGRKVTRLLRQEFGDVHIEDLEVPYFCVSANLTDGRRTVHRRGELWRWLRAAVAIPGVLPPVFCDGSVLVDGATINNLPVDVMRQLNRGPLVAVDVGVDETFGGEAAQAAPRGMLRRLRGEPPSPNIFQILLRAGMINSAANTAAVRAQTDVLLAPPLPRIDLLDWRAFDRAVEAGYRYAREHLHRCAELLPATPGERSP